MGEEDRKAEDAKRALELNVASPDVPAEMRDKLTEWVTVMAFSEALQTKGVAKLVVQKRERRMGRNPATGAPVEIPAKQVVKARIATQLKNVVEA